MNTIEGYVDRVNSELREQQADDLSFVSYKENFLDKFIEKVREKTVDEAGSNKRS